MAEDVAFDGSTNIVDLMLSDEANNQPINGEPSDDATAKLLDNVAESDPKDTDTETLFRSQKWLANICFLLIGVGVAMAWTACRAGIAYFSSQFPLGSSFYTYMVVAYNVPVLPLLISQTLWDQHQDERHGSRVTYTCRLVISMTVMACCLILVPFGGQAVCLAAVALVGVFDSVSYGTACQYFAMFPSVVSGFYFIGASLTSLISIALTFATGFTGAHPTAESAKLMFGLSALVVFIGLGAALVLLNSKLGRHYLDEKDRMARLRRLKAGRKSLIEDLEDDPPTPSITNRDLFNMTFWCHATLFVGWFGTNIVDSLISFVPSQDDTPTFVNRDFRLIVLYGSLLGELAGKQLNIARGGRFIKSAKTLFYVVLARFLCTIPFILYVSQPNVASDGRYHFRLDGLYVAYQVLFDMSGSYCSSGAYAVAPALLAHALWRPQSSTLLAITLTLGVYAGLSVSLGLTQMLSIIPASSLA